MESVTGSAVNGKKSQQWFSQTFQVENLITDKPETGLRLDSICKILRYKEKILFNKGSLLVIGFILT